MSVFFLKAFRKTIHVAKIKRTKTTRKIWMKFHIVSLQKQPNLVLNRFIQFKSLKDLLHTYFQYIRMKLASSVKNLEFPGQTIIPFPNTKQKHWTLKCAIWMVKWMLRVLYFFLHSLLKFPVKNIRLPCTKPIIIDFNFCMNGTKWTIWVAFRNFALSRRVNAETRG
jgi:hypothetical protein